MDYEWLSDLIVTGVRDVLTAPAEAGRSNSQKDRPCWGIFLKYTGETVYTCKGKKYLCKPDSVVILPAGCSYEYESTVAGEFGWINFHANLNHDEVIQIPYKNTQAVLDTIRKIEFLRISRTPMYQMICIAEVYELLIKLFKALAPKYTSSESQRKIQPAMDYLLHNYTQPLTNDELAAQTNLSTSYFRKVFGEVHGTTPLHYQQSLRIQRAKHMLLSNTSSVSEIAAYLGYANIYDFSRAFKRVTGLSPTAYARSAAGMSIENEQEGI